MDRRKIIPVLFCFLSACTTSPERAPVIGEGFAGAMTLPVRDELSLRAKVVATLNYGDRIEIIGKRRRFLKVRTSGGAEGWVDSTQLFTRDDIEALRQLAQRAAGMQSQGEATVFDLLNVHSAPNRQAPNYFQIRPGQYVSVITHQRAPRVPFVPPNLLFDSPTRRAPRAKKKKEPSIPPPPRGRPPLVPDDWLEISGHGELAGLDADEALEKIAQSSAEPDKPPPAVAYDDWTLVRARDGRAGWALTRMLFMAIPDEVAQYAERARISAYFVVGSAAAQDGKPRPEWLWATLSRGGQDIHFDSLRLFTFNQRRKRYETAFIDRKVAGWLPIQLRRSSGGEVIGFAVITREPSGLVERREYAYTGGRVRLAGKQGVERPPDWYAVSEKGGRGRQVLPPQDSPSWQERATELLQQIRKRVAK